MNAAIGRPAEYGRHVIDEAGDKRLAAIVVSGKKDTAF
jgi:hypothetical protein